MVEGEGFEPSNPREQIYSLPALNQTCLPFREMAQPRGQPKLSHYVDDALKQLSLIHLKRLECNNRIYRLFAW